MGSDNQVEFMREIKGLPSEKLYLEFGEATPRTGVEGLGEGWDVFAFQFVQQKSRQMLVPPPILVVGR